MNLLSKKPFIFFAVLPSLIYLFLIFFQLIEFKLGNQVIDLHNGRSPIGGVNPIEIHQHFLRYLLVLPVFKIHDWTGVSINYIFSIYCAVILLVSTGIMTHTMRKIRNISNFYWEFFLLFLITLGCLSVFMNGRALFLILGSVILLNLLVDLSKGYVNWKYFLLGQVVSLWLLSTSSGAYIISFLILLLMCIIYIKKEFVDFSKSYYVIAQLILLFLFSIFFYQYLYINIVYFGSDIDSVYKMLYHGFGHFLLDWELLSIFLFTGLFFLYLAFKYLRDNKILIYVLSISIFGGLFGWTTLATAIPSLLLLTAVAGLKIKEYLDGY